MALHHTHRTQSRARVSQALRRIRQAVRQPPSQRLTAFCHHLTVDCLREAYFALQRDAAPGVDGVTWEESGQDWELRLQDLHRRVQQGTYRAQPVRRRSIAKASGGERPLGGSALEDKVVQRAVVAILNQIYEEAFLGCRYGFRPGRSQHDALDALATGILRQPINGVLALDVVRGFDSFDRVWLERVLQHRIGDRRRLRLIRKWRKAGGLEDHSVIEPDRGVVQGAVGSPLRSNI